MPKTSPKSPWDAAPRVRLRPDLQFQASRSESTSVWTIKDPIALTYHQVSAEEHTILTMLDGKTTYPQIQQHFERVFAPQRLVPAHLFQFLAELHAKGLVISDGPGQPETMRSRTDHRRRLQWLRWSNPLVWRFPGIHPEPYLTWMYRCSRWLFSPTVRYGSLLLMLLAVFMVALHVRRVPDAWPSLSTLLQTGNTPWLVLTIITMKCLHELGHALACKHFGGECPEMGVQLVCFMPCLYCNVSDAAMFPSQWKRMAVAGAGIVVELVIAAMLAIVWCLSAPGTLHSVCEYAMLVGSVGTVFVNGNALLRYDGYFLLADWFQVPNLWERSRTLLSRALAQHCLGIPAGNPRDEPRRWRWAMMAYAVCSITYSWLVIGFALAIMLYWLQALHLEVLGRCLAMLTLLGIVAPPLLRGAQTLQHANRRSAWSPWRTLLSLILLVLGAAGALWVPVPRSLLVPLIAEASQVRHIFVSSPGVLTQSMRTGQSVAAEESIATLRNESLQQRAMTLRAEREQLALHLGHLELEAADAVERRSQIPTIRESLRETEARLRVAEQDLSELTVRAPVTGTVLPPLPKDAATPNADEEQLADPLPTWDHVPLDPVNMGAFFDAGTWLCSIGNPHRLEGVLLIPSDQVGEVEVGQLVRMQFDQLTAQTIEGRIIEIARAEWSIAPLNRKPFAPNLNLPHVWPNHGGSTPESVVYRARVAFDQMPPVVRMYSRGKAKIVVAPETLFARLQRLVTTTFNP